MIYTNRSGYDKDGYRYAYWVSDFKAGGTLGALRLVVTPGLRRHDLYRIDMYDWDTLICEGERGIPTWHGYLNSEDLQQLRDAIDSALNGERKEKVEPSICRSQPICAQRVTIT